MAHKRKVLAATAVTGSVVPSNQLELQPGRPNVYALLIYTEGTEVSVDIGYEVRPDNDSDFIAADWFRFCGPPVTGSGATPSTAAVTRFTPTGVPGTIQRRCVPLKVAGNWMARLTVVADTPGGGPGTITAYLVQSF